MRLRSRCVVATGYGGIFYPATLLEIFYAAAMLEIFLMGCWSVPRQTGFPLAGADWSMLMRSRAPSGRGPLLR